MEELYQTDRDAFMMFRPFPEYHRRMYATMGAARRRTGTDGARDHLTNVTKLCVNTTFKNPNHIK